MSSLSSEIWARITRGCSEIISEKELRAKLEKGRPLRIKLGVDPTAPDLHLGHYVALRKLRTFQDLGHQIDFLIGDFTARIGDPTGRSETRPALTQEEIQKHASTYQDQVFRVLDRAKTKVRYNSEWLDALGPMGLMQLAGHATVAQMLKRADFKKRLETEGGDVTMLEFMYPLLQGYDSYALQSDVELGGTDQKFNLLMGREIQRDYKQELQVVMMMPLLEGLDGVKKMSKSYGNYVAFNDPPQEMFGKIMSIPDALMPKYWELLTDADVHTVMSGHPRVVKGQLAKTLVARFYNEEAGEKAAAEFERVFAKKEIPEEIPEFRASHGTYRVADLLFESGVVTSKNEARRLIDQGAVNIDGKRAIITEPLNLESPKLIQVGKRRFVRIIPT